MTAYRTFENTIYINASATAVEKCFIDLELMHRWLNPALRCEPVGEWNTDVGGRSRFLMQIPVLQPKLLSSRVVEREPGLVVWQFDGVFQGRDRWECYPENGGTRLLNRFQFRVPNPLIEFGFDAFASKLTQKDMKDQLKRLKRVAEEVYLVSGRVR